ncbi:hypothetical protein BDZ88DRAFT_409182 [Geranomyces variabilis]|nr:hypothetical protein BDZ88DRAFT_409182 [Geranomyces variabilis]KAJ3139858.1 hypothetical protein HDU90_008756 [Geranomyces variabilis]
MSTAATAASSAPPPPPQSRESFLRAKQLDKFLLLPVNTQIDQTIDARFDELLQLAREQFGQTVNRQKVEKWVEEQLSRMKVFEQVNFESEAKKIWQSADMQEILHAETTTGGASVAKNDKDSAPPQSKKRSRENSTPEPKSKRSAKRVVESPENSETDLSDAASSKEEQPATGKRQAVPHPTKGKKDSNPQLEAVIPQYATGSTVAAQVPRGKQSTCIYALKIKSYDPARKLYLCVDPAPERKKKSSWNVSPHHLVDYTTLTAGTTYKADDHVYALSRIEGGGLTTVFYSGVVEKVLPKKKFKIRFDDGELQTVAQENMFHSRELQTKQSPPERKNGGPSQRSTPSPSATFSETSE